MSTLARKSKILPDRAEGPLRACGYYRVSTGRQAESDLSDSRPALSGQAILCDEGLDSGHGIYRAWRQRDGRPKT